ncbi:hypothetical protein BCY75_09465 [Latilactobacillus curvatus]|uniref:hypothetical protein n=1 Tax=Latilactobacillus curvatus TaxID=28038 RepID=UPI00081530DA|nr:hypothetical protein [Latilactobacillus curvatus]ANY14205.1 hypothetical protein BCY75_09465 [Latilactobacillus curvatus]
MDNQGNKKLSYDKIKKFLKKIFVNNRIRYSILLVVGIVIIPTAINIGIKYIPGTGSNEGWLGFWGGYLGSCIAVIFAYENTKFQLKEQRKSDLRNAIKIKQIEAKNQFSAENNKYISDLSHYIGAIKIVNANKIEGVINNKAFIDLENMFHTYQQNWNSTLAIDINGMGIIDNKVKRKCKKTGTIDENWRNFKTSYMRLSSLVSKGNSNEAQRKDLIKEMSNYLENMNHYVKDVNVKLATSINLLLYDTEK